MVSHEFTCWEFRSSPLVDARNFCRLFCSLRDLSTFLRMAEDPFLAQLQADAAVRGWLQDDAVHFCFVASVLGSVFFKEPLSEGCLPGQ